MELARSAQLAQLFDQPQLPIQHHYEICRAYFHEDHSVRELAKDGSEVPQIASVKELSLDSGREFVTEVAGLFLFVRQLRSLDFPAAVCQAALPGSENIPPLQAILALLAPMLLGKRPVSHMSDLNGDATVGQPMVGEYNYLKSFWSLNEVMLTTLYIYQLRRPTWVARYSQLARQVVDDKFSRRPNAKKVE